MSPVFDWTRKWRKHMKMTPLTPIRVALFDDDPDPQFLDWWERVGRSLDPDPGVSWEDKRRDFAALVYAAGKRSA